MSRPAECPYEQILSTIRSEADAINSRPDDERHAADALLAMSTAAVAQPELRTQQQAGTAHPAAAPAVTRPDALIDAFGALLPTSQPLVGAPPIRLPGEAVSVGGASGAAGCSTPPHTSASAAAGSGLTPLAGVSLTPLRNVDTTSDMITSMCNMLDETEGRAALADGGDMRVDLVHANVHHEEVVGGEAECTQDHSVCEPHAAASTSSSTGAAADTVVEVAGKKIRHVISDDAIYLTEPQCLVTDVYTSFFPTLHYDEFKRVLSRYSVKQIELRPRGVEHDWLPCIALSELNRLLESGEARREGIARITRLSVSTTGAAACLGPPSRESVDVLLPVHGERRTGELTSGIRTRHGDRRNIGYLDIEGTVVPCWLSADVEGGGLVRTVDLFNFLHPDKKGRASHASMHKHMELVRAACSALGVATPEISDNARCIMTVCANPPSMAGESLEAVCKGDVLKVLQYVKNSDANLLLSTSRRRRSQQPRRPSASSTPRSSLESAPSGGAPSAVSTGTASEGDDSAFSTSSRSPGAPTAHEAHGAGTHVEDDDDKDTDYVPSAKVRRRDAAPPGKRAAQSKSPPVRTATATGARPMGYAPTMVDPVGAVVAAADMCARQGMAELSRRVKRICKPVVVCIEDGLAIPVMGSNEQGASGHTGKLLEHLFVAGEAPCILCHACYKLTTVRDFVKHEHGVRLGSAARLYYLNMWPPSREGDRVLSAVPLGGGDARAQAHCRRKAAHEAWGRCLLRMRQFGLIQYAGNYDCRVLMDAAGATLPPVERPSRTSLSGRRAVSAAVKKKIAKTNTAVDGGEHKHSAATASEAKGDEVQFVLFDPSNVESSPPPPVPPWPVTAAYVPFFYDGYGDRAELERAIGERYAPGSTMGRVPPINVWDRLA